MRATATTERAPGASSEAPAARPASAMPRRIAADDPDRRLAQPVTMAQLFLRFDATHELPHVVETATGQIVARFALPGDLALFIGAADRKTLPADYVRHYTGGQ